MIIVLGGMGRWDGCRLILVRRLVFVRENYMNLKISMSVAFALLSVACSQQQSSSNYTGKFKVDAGTEYVALESPSRIGGACDGWKTVEIRKSNQSGAGMTNVICWKREGDAITITDRVGKQRTSGPAAAWSD